MKRPKFNATKDEQQLIIKIARRFQPVADAYGIDVDYTSLCMDIEACHCNGCPLDLNKLASAEEYDFAHDVFGIRRHINRLNGALEDCFLPRCAMPQPTNHE